MPTGKVNERNAHVKVRYLEKNSDIKEVQQLEWEYNWNENTMPPILKRFIPIQLFHNWYKLVEGSCVHTNLILKPVTYSHQLGDRYTGLGAQKTLFKPSFSVVFPQKIRWISDDFRMHPIISKWLTRQKCRREKQEEIEGKEETIYESVFIHLNT